MLGELSEAEFLRDYWQQKPLLIRQAFPDFESPITPDELAGLACEVDAARIVIEKGGNYPWEVRHGAFREKEFATLPETHWTLLVNDTDLYLPELKQVMEPFRFIPDWRMDDLMISFAVAGGSVGPHVDEYDVFLIQAHGQRRWQITTQTAKPDNFLPDLELRIMREFIPEQEWVLEPGDMLYLPPNVPHYGVALNDCMTYSVGFRAPSQADMLQFFIEELLEQPRLQQRFADRQRKTQANPGEISAADLETLLNLLNEGLKPAPQTLQVFLGKYLSRPRETPIYSKQESDQEPNSESLIKQGISLQKSLGARLIYFLEKERILLFANGKEYQLKPETEQFVQFICKNSILEPDEYQQFMSNRESFSLLTKLLKHGAFLAS